jgi:hypothetical protein
MSVIARLLLSWTAVSVAVSPLIGMMIHRQQLDLPAAPGATPLPIRTAVAAR